MINLDDLRNATGGQLFGEVAAVQFSGFCHEVHLVEKNQMFVAIKTPTRDGHRQIEEALNCGASGVLCQDPPTCDVTGITVVLVGDTVAALGQWAAYVLRQFGPTVIGVAGTIGKSSTREAIASVLGKRYTVYNKRHMLPGCYGVALGLSGLESSDHIALVELATDHLDDLQELLAITQPLISIITNATPEQTEELYDVERIKTEIQHILDALPPNGTAVINCDDTLLGAMQSEIRAGLLTYSWRRDDKCGFRGDLIAHDVQFHTDKVVLDLLYGKDRYKGHRIPVLGKPGLYAALAALSVGVLFEIPLQEGLQALSEFRPLPGHLRPFEARDEVLLIDDTFDAGPASTLAALDMLATIRKSKGRHILVLGDISCHEDYAQQAYETIGQQAPAAVDLLVTRGKLASLAGIAAREHGLPSGQIVQTYSHQDAAHITRRHTRPGDLVLVAGGRHARMERVCEYLLASQEDRIWLPRQTMSCETLVTTPPPANSWIEIELEAIAHNMRELTRRVGPNVDLMAVVEANAYGHGATQVAHTAIHNGASLLGVASVDEGLELRRAGVDTPIIILGYTPAWDAQRAIRHDMILTTHSHEMAQAYAHAAREIDHTAQIQIKVDLDSGQPGLLPQEIAPLIRNLVRMEGLKIDGIYADLPSAGNLIDIAYTHEQLSKFDAVLNSILATGLSLSRIHAANSAAILSLPESHYTLVRADAVLYGLDPSPEMPCPSNFRRALTWKTTVVQMKALPEILSASYDSHPQTHYGSRVAVIPVGYIDGFRNSATRGWGEVLVRGQRVPTTCWGGMSQSVIDISHVPDAQIGDEVVLIGQQGKEEITVEDIARRLNVTNCEVTAGIGPHVPRLI